MLSEQDPPFRQGLIVQLLSTTYMKLKVALCKPNEDAFTRLIECACSMDKRVVHALGMVLEILE